MVIKMYPQNSKIETTDNSSNLRGIPVPALTGDICGSAPTVALRWSLRSLVLTTSIMARKGKTGRITAL